ncbi:MAG TPA: peptide-methionine (S)-S-oxide reductase MsrA [Rhodocyclaceae bacterium]
MTQQDFKDPAGTEVAVLGGGCFWCIEAVFQRLRGVHSVVSGYSGGSRPAPSYEQVCTGASGHAEVVRIAFDPQVIDFASLLDVFFAVHDPTTLDRQGHDIGSQYRSVIFCQNAGQRAEAAAAIRRIDAAGYWGAPAVTELAGKEPFWPAEDYHRNYYDGHRSQPYCQAVIAPKVAKLQVAFKDLLGPPRGPAR